MSDYTPTTEQVRELCKAAVHLSMKTSGDKGENTAGDEFDRWLAAELAAAERRGAAKALREYAEAKWAWQYHKTEYFQQLLARRADQIESAAKPSEEG